MIGRGPAVFPAGVRDRFPDDDALRRYEVDAYAGAPLFQADGRPAGLLAVMHRQPFRHVAQLESVMRIFAVGAAAELERARAEEERQSLEDRLHQSQKMETIGQLAGGVAHDFNNLLSPILGYSEMVLADLPPEDPRHRQLTFIRDAADKAAGLTKQLLSFSRKQLLEARSLDLNRLVTTSSASSGARSARTSTSPCGPRRATPRSTGTARRSSRSS